MNSTYYPEIDRFFEELRQERTVDKFDYFNRQTLEAENLISKMKNLPKIPCLLHLSQEKVFDDLPSS